MMRGTDQVEDMEVEPTWTWYYLADCQQWHQVEDDPDNPFSSQDLEKSYTRNQTGTLERTSFTGTSYVDFKMMCQQDATGKVRRIKRHFNIERSCSCFVAAPVFWELVHPTTSYQLIPLYQVTDEFKDVANYVKNEGLLDQTILSICRIQNLDLWEFYCRKKKQLMRIHKRKDIQERRLFHGTDVKNIQAICKYNFDLRLARDDCLFGRGIYFAKHASYAHNYSRGFMNKVSGETYRYIILARVMIGTSTAGQKHFRKPDEGSCENDHNSCVDNINHPQMFVIFDPNQIYPEYLIKYRI